MLCFPSTVVHHTAARLLVSDLLYITNVNDHTLLNYELKLADGSPPCGEIAHSNFCYPRQSFSLPNSLLMTTHTLSVTQCYDIQFRLWNRDLTS